MFDDDEFVVFVVRSRSKRAAPKTLPRTLVPATTITSSYGAGPCPQFAQDRHIEPARSRGSRCALRLLIKYTIMYTISSSHEWHKVVRREPHGGWEQSRSAAPRKRR